MRAFFICLSVFVIAATARADSYSEVTSADTWIRNDEPGGPYGSSGELRTNNVTSCDQEIVMLWDLSTIPGGVTINSAVLHAYRYEGSSAGSLTCELFRVTETWDEATLVTEIDHDTGTSYASINVSGNGWYDFDIAALVQEWVDGTYDNYGIVFYGTSGAGYYQKFCSKEYWEENKPYLEIDYDVPSGVEGSSLGGIKAAFK